MSLRVLSLIGAGLLLLSGCGGVDDPREPISGVVQINGQPLQAGRISFQPQSTEGAQALSMGVQAGKFRSYSGEGLLPGVYRVEIEDRAVNFAPDDDLAYAQYVKSHRKAPPRTRIPAIYNRRSELTAEVIASSENEFRFELHIKGYEP